MSDWNEIVLGKLGQTFSGLSGKTKEDFGSGKPYIPYLNIFSNSRINPNALELVEIKPIERQNRVQYGDIFFTTSSETIEEVGMTSVLLHELGEVYLNSFCFGFRLFDFDTLLPEFAAYLLRSENVRHQISFNGQGSTRYNLSKSQLLKNVVLTIPTKPEQSTIATILTTIDQAIEKTAQLIAKYERIKTGLMQDLLTRGIDEQGNIRSEETHEFKDSPLGRIPKAWRIGTVGQDCRIHNSFRKPLSAEVRENMKGKYPYYGPTGILDYINEFRVDGKYVLIGEDGDHFLKFISQEMTLLVNGKFNVNNHAHILEGKEDCITEWIHCFFCHRDITYHLTRQGAGRFKLNKAALSNLQIAIPKKDEQIRIIGKIDEIRNYLHCEEETLNNFKNLKDGLMQDLLTGKICVDSLLEKHSI